MIELLDEMVKIAEQCECMDSMKAKRGRWTIEIETDTYHEPHKRVITLTRIADEEGEKNV